MEYFVWGHSFWDCHRGRDQIKRVFDGLALGKIDTVSFFVQGSYWKRFDAADWHDGFLPGRKNVWYNSNISELKKRIDRDLLGEIMDVAKDYPTKIGVTVCPTWPRDLDEDARLLQRRAGSDGRDKFVPMMCLSNPEVHEFGLAMIDEICRDYAPHLIDLDYLRYSYEQNPCVCQGCTEHRKKWLSENKGCRPDFDTLSPEEKKNFDVKLPAPLPEPPKDFWGKAYADIDMTTAAYKEFEMRVANVEAFLQKARQLTKKHNTPLACYFQLGSLAPIALGQDWVRFCRAGLVDEMSTGTFGMDVPTFRSQLDEGFDLVKGYVKRVPIVAKGFPESGKTISAQSVMRQTEVAIASGFEGVGFFPLRFMTDEDYKAIAEVKDL
jgi:hypothetical protein